MIYQFKNFIPVIDPSSFVHPLAAVTGNVEIGKQVYIGPFAALRGDFGKIVISDGCNIQEGCVLHTFPGATCILHENAHMGHGSIVHGATIGKNCLIGMNAVIMDEAIIEDECIIGALSFIKQRGHFKQRSLIVGNPAKKIRDVSDEMISWKSDGTKLYQQLAADMLQHWKPAEPLLQKARQADQSEGYKPWKKN